VPRSAQCCSPRKHARRRASRAGKAGQSRPLAASRISPTQGRKIWRRKGCERAAPAGHESQLAYGSPAFVAGGVPHRPSSRTPPG